MMTLCKLTGPQCYGAILTFLLSYRSYDLLEHCLPSKTRTKTRITYCSCFKTDTSYDQIGQYDKIYGFEIYQTMMNNILGKIQNSICKEIKVGGLITQDEPILNFR